MGKIANGEGMQSTVEVKKKKPLEDTVPVKLDLPPVNTQRIVIKEPFVIEGKKPERAENKPMKFPETVIKANLTPEEWKQAREARKKKDQEG
jgi:hypothetical protein